MRGIGIAGSRSGRRSMVQADRPANTSPEAPEQRYVWFRPFIPRKLQPWLRGLRKRWQLRSLDLKEPFRTVFPYTQASRSRQANLLRLAETIDADGTPGAIVECGVLDGGTAALMAYGTRKSARSI